MIVVHLLLVALQSNTVVYLWSPGSRNITQCSDHVKEVREPTIKCFTKLRNPWLTYMQLVRFLTVRALSPVTRIWYLNSTHQNSPEDINNELALPVRHSIDLDNAPGPASTISTIRLRGASQFHNKSSHLGPSCNALLRPHIRKCCCTLAHCHKYCIVH